MPTFSISTWLNIGLAVLALSGLGYGKYKAYELDAYKVNQAQLVHDKEVQSQSDADQIRKDKDAQIKLINNQLADALVQLRSRPSRSESTNLGSSGTGSTLYAEDAEFLIREAAKADEIRTGLEACYKQYDAIAK